MPKPLIQAFTKNQTPCTTCGGNIPAAIKDLMEDKPQTFVVQVVVEALDVLDINRELLGKGRVLSANPYRDPVQQPQQTQKFSIMNQSQSTEKKVFPAQPALNG